MPLFNRNMLLLLLATLAAVGCSAFIGRHSIRLAEVLDPAAPGIFWQLRVPRVALAAVAGAGLALGGAVFQIIFRNPLATPDTLGISSAAAFAASVGILTDIRSRWLGLPVVSELAIGGALSAIAMIAWMARGHAIRDRAYLLLVGVCVASMSSAGIVLATYLADATITNEIVRWLMGSLVTVELRHAGIVAAALLPALAICLLSHRGLDLLAFGDAVAASRGVAAGPIVWSCLLAIGALTAIIVGFCGPIAFVGLIAPHIVRGLIGGRSLVTIVAATLFGAGFLPLCDALARVISDYELPVGVLTSIGGAMFFIWLLRRDSRIGGAARG